MANEKIKLEIDVETGDISSGFKKITNQAEKSGEEAARGFSGKFRNSIKSGLSGLGGQLAGVIGFAALTQVVSRATRSAIEFQEAFTEINTLLPKTASLTEKNAAKFKEFAAEYGTTATSQAKSFYNIVSAGVTDTAEATELLNTANKLAIGGVTDVQNAIDILTTSVNAYNTQNLSARDAADALFTTVRLGKTRVDELAVAFGRVLPQAQLAGITFDEAAASVATLTKNGIATNEAVTALRSLFSSFRLKAENLGDQFTQTAIQNNGLIKTLEILRERQRASGKSFQELLGRKEAVAAAATLLKGNLDELTMSMTEMEGKTGAAGDAFNKIADTDAFRFNQAISSIKTSLLELGENILPTVAKGITNLSGFVDKITFAAGLEEEVDTLAAINTEIVNTTTELEKQKRVLEEFKDTQKGDGSFLDVFNKKTNAQIEKQGEVVARLQRKLSLLNKTRQEFAKPPEGGRSKEGGGAGGTRGAGEGEEENRKRFISNVGLTKPEILKQRRDQNLATLREANEKGLLDEEEYIARKQEVQAQYEENQIASFDNIASAFERSAQRQQASAKQLATALNRNLAGGLGKTFESVGASLAKGENASQAFADGIKGTLSDLSGTIGDFYIKRGIARIAAGDPNGGAVLAAGFGLKALSGAIGADVGGGGGSSTGGGGGGFVGSEPLATPTALEQEPIEQAEAQSQVTVNIDRFVGEEEEAQRVAEILSEAGAKNGLLLSDVRSFA